jgi:hypothetical protein
MAERGLMNFEVLSHVIAAYYKAGKEERQEFVKNLEKYCGVRREKT